MITFDPNWTQLLTLVVAILLPLLVGLVTKLETSSARRTVWLAALSAVFGLLSELLTALQANEAFDLDSALLNWLGIFVISVASYFGAWKPLGTAQAAQAIGSPPPPAPEETRSSYRDRL
jgi:hypothetical protein